MAVRTFRGAVNSDWNTAGNWLEGFVPTVADDVFFDAASPACTLSAAGNCLTLDCTGFLSTITPGANTVTCAGLLFRLVAGCWVAGTCLIDFTSVAGATLITPAGNTVNAVRVGNGGAGGTYQLQNAMITVLDFDHVRGTVQTNNQGLTVGRDLLHRATVLAGSLALGSSIVSIGRNWSWLVTNIMSVAAHYGTSQIRLTGTGNLISGAFNTMTVYDLRIAEAGQTVQFALSNPATAFQIVHQLSTGPGLVAAGTVTLTLTSALAAAWNPDPGCDWRQSFTYTQTGVTVVATVPPCTYTANLTLARAGGGTACTFQLTGNLLITGNLIVDDTVVSTAPQMVDFNGFNLTVTGNLTSGSAGVYTGFNLNVGNSALRVNGNLVHAGTGGTDRRMLTATAAGTITVLGNFTLTGTATACTIDLRGSTMIVGGNWNTAANAAPVFIPGLDTAATIQFTAAVPFTITADANSYWPLVIVSGGGTVVLPNGFNCFAINITAGLVTAGNPFTCRTSLSNAGTFTGSANMFVGTSFVNSGILVMAGTNLRMTGALCSVGGVNPVTLTMAGTCLRLQLLTSMTITTFVVEDRVLPGVVQYLAGGTFNINTFNSQIASTDGATQFVSSVAGTRYTWRVGVAITSVANVWPRDADSSGSAIVPVGGITVKDLGNNLGWNLNPVNVAAAFIRVVTEDAGQDLLAAGGIGPINYCWLVGTSLANIAALAAAYAGGANNWHRKTCIPFAMLDNLVKGTTYWLALGLVDDRGRRATPNIGGGDFTTAIALSPESGGGGYHNLHVQTQTVAFA